MAFEALKRTGRKLMRHIGPAGICLIGLVTGAIPAGAQVGSQEAPKAALPAATACPAAVAEFAICYSAKLETGAYLLAAMPKEWNGNLIVFGHGGPAVIPPTATRSQNDLAKYSFPIQ